MLTPLRNLSFTKVEFDQRWRELFGNFLNKLIAELIFGQIKLDYLINVQVLVDVVQALIYVKIESFQNHIPWVAILGQNALLKYCLLLSFNNILLVCNLFYFVDAAYKVMQLVVPGQVFLCDLLVEHFLPNVLSIESEFFYN